MLRHPAILALGLLFGLPLLAGCGSLFGQRYDNFTAYYNTFYNARRVFEREERVIKRADEPVDRSRYINLFARPAQAGRGSAQAFDSAIRRSADVLRDHPDSRWVDDALLLIGKSYFYQGNFDAAAQKFREVLSLEGTRLDDEAILWLGRSLMGARDYGAAADVLRNALEQGEVGRRWKPRLQLALAEVLLRRGDLDVAEAVLVAGLEHLDDRTLGARAAFLLGQIQDSRGEYSAAAEAYGRALSMRPSPEVEYAALLQRSLALGRSGNPEAALAIMDRMRRDDRFFQQRGEVEMIRARSLALAGRPGEAHELLQRLLYDRDPAIRIDRIRGPLHYRLAELYRDYYEDYPRAAAHFDSSATALRQTVQSLRDAFTTAEAILDADRQADAFGSFARVRGRLVEMDSLLYLGALDEDAFEEAIAVMVEQRRQELLAEERERRRIAEQQGFGGTVAMPGRGEGRDAGEGDAAGADTGFLSFRNPVRVQENLVAFQSRWGERPRVPDWRRSAAISGAAMIADGENGDVRVQPGMRAPVGALDALIDISGIPRTPEAFLEVRQSRAEARYELGNVLFLTLAQPEVAADWYRLVIEEDGDLPVALRAAFALGEALLSIGDTDGAAELFRYVADGTPDGALLTAARDRLGLAPLETAPDSLDLARQGYSAAFEVWEQGEHSEAFLGMIRVAADYSMTPEAARARLAAGMIYTEWAAADTLRLLAVDPVLLADAGRLQEAGFFRVMGLDIPTEQHQLLSGSENTDAPVAPDNGDEPTAGNNPETTSGIAPADTTSLVTSDAALPTPAVPERVEEDDTPEELDETPEAETGSDGEEVQQAWLLEWYAAISRDYPNTPFADRARALRRPLEDLHNEFAALRLAAREAAAVHAPAEEIPEDDQLLPGDIGDGHGLLFDDEPETADIREQTIGTFDETSLRSDEPIDSSVGGFTWAAHVTPRQFEAQNRMITFFNRGYRTAMLVRDGAAGEEFVVLVGQFETQAAAEAARNSLPTGANRQNAFVMPLEPATRITLPADLISP